MMDPLGTGAGRASFGAVVVYTDLGSRSAIALRAAGDLARRHDAELHVLHALDVVGRALREMVRPLHEGILFRAREALDRQIAESLGHLPEPPVSRLDGRDPRRALVDLVRHTDAGLVVVPSLAAMDPPAQAEGLLEDLASLERTSLLALDGARAWPMTRIRWPMPAPIAPARVKWRDWLDLGARDQSGDGAGMLEVRALEGAEEEVRDGAWRAARGGPTLYLAPMEMRLGEEPDAADRDDPAVAPVPSPAPL